MRNFSKKLAFVLAAAMVFTAFAPAANAKADEDMAINRKSQTLYVNEGLNHKGADTLPEGLYGNVSEYDFFVDNKPTNWKTDYTFDWSSSDDDVMTVGKAGLATAVAPGEADVVCVVTEKATGKATTLKATVTVKANAETITITNAEDFEDQAFMAGDEIALTYKMEAENGGKATDLIKWVAEPATGVTVKDGVFTFGEDAIQGPYTLYAETYQSDKYNQVTATSEKIVVNYVVDNTFEIKQLNKNQFDVKFDSPVSALTTADVTVTHMLELLSGNYPFPVYVTDVKLATDGMSATVTLDEDLLHDNKYIVNVKGFEEDDFTASLGHPAYFKIYAKDAEDGVVVTAGDLTPLLVKFYDAKDVEVTPENPNVLFRLETRSTDGKYYLSGNNDNAKIMIKDAGKPVTVIAEYQGRVENGKRVGQLDTKEQFVAVAQKEIKLDSMGKASFETDLEKPADLTMRKAEKPQLWVNFVKTDASKTLALTNFGTFDNGNYQVSYTAMTPSVAVIAKDGTITAFKDGEAHFYVNLAQKNANGSDYGTPTPVAIVTVIVEKDAAFKSASLDDYSIVIGTNESEKAFHTGKLTMSADDTYGDAWNITGEGADIVDIQCLSDGYDKNAFDTAIVPAYADKKATLNIDAAKIAELMGSNAPAKGQAAVLYFKAVYKDYACEFSVLIQEPGDAAGNYIEIVTDGDNIDAVRINEKDKDKDKSVTFEVFELNNEVKVGRFKFEAAPAAAKDISEGAYCYKILKNGEKLDSKFIEADLEKGTVTVKFSYTDPTKKTVVYAGEGTYEFILEQRVGKTDADAVLVQMYSASVYSYVGEKGTYNLVKPLTYKAPKADYSTDANDLQLLQCFEITDRAGETVLTKEGAKNPKAKYDSYVVTKNAPANSGFVYVEKITFNETVDDATVSYDVVIDTVLEIKSK